MTFLQNGKRGKKDRLSQEWRIGEYVRLSKEDGDKPESDSIQNQHRIISNHIEYMKQQGEKIAAAELYSDDGYPGGNFNRPAHLLEFRLQMLRRLHQSPAHRHSRRQSVRP